MTGGNSLATSLTGRESDVKAGVYMDQPKQQSVLRRYKLVFQSVALFMMLAVPVLLYWTTRAGLEEWVMVLLAALGTGMAIATVVN